MRRRWIVLSVLACALIAERAPAQMLSARRMAMGGVLLAGGGPGSDASNVAYRAVPPAHGMATALPLPIGLIPFIADPPELDPDKPDFNIYELANTLYNPPWNLQIVQPDPPSSDITISIAKNSLGVDLGDIKSVFPKDHSRVSATTSSTLIGFGVKHAFIALAPLVQYENDLSLNAALHAALADGQPFEPNTDYTLYDNAKGQAAIGIDLGVAAPLMAAGGDPRSTGSAFYAGARVKVLRGLAYGSADNVAQFRTRDTLFAADPIDVQYTGMLRDAGPDGGRMGRGLDLGAVWLSRGFELGVGVNDVATRLHWKVRESIAYRDSASGDYVQQILADGVAFESTVPVHVTVNAAVQLGSMVVAGDVVHGGSDTFGHVGVENWFGPIALRAGGGLDANRLVQFAGGGGVKFGRLGFDLALATNSRNLSRERGLELGAALAFYGKD